MNGKHEDELFDKLLDILDEHFPKGKCKERGQAMVFLALSMIEIRKAKNKSFKDGVMFGSAVKDDKPNHDKLNTDKHSKN